MKKDNKMNINRREFLKTAALAGAALAMPAGLDRVFAAEPKQPEASRTMIQAPPVSKDIAYWERGRRPSRYRLSVSA